MKIFAAVLVIFFLLVAGSQAADSRCSILGAKTAKSKSEYDKSTVALAYQFINLSEDQSVIRLMEFSVREEERSLVLIKRQFEKDGIDAEEEKVLTRATDSLERNKQLLKGMKTIFNQEVRNASREEARNKNLRSKWLRMNKRLKQRCYRTWKAYLVS